MKIERLKRNHKKQVIIGAVAICIVGGTLTFNLTRAKYKITESIPLVRGTVNYKVPDLRTVALYTANDSGVYQETNDIPTSGYVLNTTKSVCKVYDGTTSVENAPVDSSISIEYRGGKVTFANLTKRNTRCYLYFDKQTTITMDNLIDSLPIKIGSPDFSKVATTDEGVYQASDGMYGGTSYYWRGAVTNNYVRFANKCWRIIRINGDKTMRLIYDGATCHANGTSTVDSIAVANTAYNTDYTRSEYVGWTYSTGSQRTLSGSASNAKSQTDAWYSSNIGNNTTYASKVADGKFCNDRNTASGYSWASQPSSTFFYAAKERLVSSNNPSLSCTNSGDIYTLKVGLITADEVVLAGGINNGFNKSYYLYNRQNYWTMSPSVSANYSNYVFYVNSNNGCLAYDGIRVHTATLGLRSVINLRSDVQFQPGGNGSLNSPYVVSN